MPLKSQFETVEIPDLPLHVIMAQIWETYGDTVAMVSADTGETFTYAQLVDQVRRVASGLVSLGMKKGDVLLISCRNCPQYVIMTYATLMAGGTVSTVNPDYTVFELSRQLKDCGATFVFTSDDLVPHIHQAASELGITETLIVLGEAPGFVSYSSLASDDGSRCRDTTSRKFNLKEDLAFILYSSGTTGVPKGVMLTHYNVVANLMQCSSPDFRDPDLMPEDPSAPGAQQVAASYLPFFHATGLFVSNVIMLAGGVKLITMEKYSTKFLLQVIQKYKVTALNAVPPVIVALTKYPYLSDFDLSSLKVAACGAAPLDRSTELKFRQKIKVTKMRQGFGMTETSPVVFLHPYWSEASGSVGMIIPNTEVKVVDPDTGREVGMGERGELWVRGPQVMKGYLYRPEETRETIDSEGWLHTGDVVYYDEKEMFYVVDRIKELIKYKAFQVAPAELEALLLEHPGIADAAVIGIPDKAAGELPRAYIVTQQGSKLTEQDVHRFVEEKVVHYKWLRGGVEFVNQIPKSLSGKILRRVLKDRAMKSKL